MTSSGHVVALQVCPGHRMPMRAVNPAYLLRDRGIRGDRHAIPRSRRQVLLIEEEILEELDLEPGQVRENITTRGIDLRALPRDTCLTLGEEVQLWLTGPCRPCHRMEEIREGLREELRGRRGTLAWVKAGGRVCVGDPIRLCRALPGGNPPATPGT